MPGGSISHFAVIPFLTTFKVKNPFKSLAKAYIRSPLRPFSASHPRLALIFNWYRDYKSLKFKYPLNKAEYSQAKAQLRRIKTYGRALRMNEHKNQYPQYLSPAQTPTSQSQSQLTQALDQPHSQTQSSGYPISSRRQRLLGLAKTARDVYIPRISGSVTQLATDVSNRAFSSDKYDANNQIKVPKDASIALYPTYTRKTPDGNYHVDVGGWIACPGLMTRKNRLILSLVKQVLRYDSSAIQSLESEKLKPDLFNDSDSESIADSVSINSGMSVESTASASGEETLRERLGYFIARFIANAELTITVGSEQNVPTRSLESVDVLTDTNGCFALCVTVPYEPSVVQVVAKQDETIFCCQDIQVVLDEGVAVISDIDDTVKLTGVIGDKRQLLTNLLLRDVELWTIPPVVKWYSQLFSDKVSFHYVSNSPVQLFPTLMKYFKAVGLPQGSLHLKQYTGNLLTSLMEPSSSRKRTALTKLAHDFPHKKFICVGDSGEYDFELYVDLASRYPDKVLAIYIRAVEGLMSNYDEKKILQELNRIMSTRKVIKVPKPEKHYHADELEDLIDLSDSVPVSPVPPMRPSQTSLELRISKPPPNIPKKPSNLKGNSVKSNVEPTAISKPAMIKAHTDSELSDQPPKLPPRRKPAYTTQELNVSTKKELYDNLHNIYYSHHFEELREMDERGGNWLERALVAAKQLLNTDTKVRFFWDSEEDLYKTLMSLMKEIDKNV